MNIEKEIFQRTKVNLNKLIKYGFIKENSIYTYERYFLNNEFKNDGEDTEESQKDSDDNPEQN